MKKFLNSKVLLSAILVVALFNATGLSAQSKAPKITYKAGAEIDSELRSSNLIFNDPDGTVYMTGGGISKLLKGISGKNLIEKFSPDLQTVTSAYILLSVPEKEEPIPAFQFAMMNSRLYAFAFSLISNDFPEYLIYGIEVDKDKLITIGKPAKIFQFTIDASDLYNASPLYIFPTFKSSPNQEQLMIIDFENIVGGSIKDISIKVFEGDLETSWVQKISAPFGTSSFNVTDLSLFDDGTLLMLGRDKYAVDYAKKALKDGKPDYMDHVVTFAEHSETIIDRKINAGDVFTKSLHAEILPDGRIIASGFYSDYSDVFADGIFYASFEKDMTTASIIKTSNFSAEFIGDQMEERFIHSNKDGDRLKDVYIRQMFARNDGSVTILAEHVVSAPNGSSTCYLDALAININSTGEITWANHIYKNQEAKANNATSDFAMTREFSFFASVFNDQILFFFNDDVDNKVTENSDEPDVFTGEDYCNLICVSIELNGVMTKHLVQEFDKDKPMPCVSMFHQTGKSDFIYFGWGHNIADDINGLHIEN